MAKTITVLDLGTSKITALISEIPETGEPRVIGSASLPSKGIRKGVVINIEEAVNVVAQVLAAAERMADRPIAGVFLSVSGEYIQCTNQKGTISITGSEITHEDVQRAVESAKTQLAPYPDNTEFIHIIPNEFTIDSQSGIKYPIGMTGSKLEVDCHFISIPKSAIQNLSKTVEKLGVEVYGTIFSGWADSYSTLTDTEKELGATLLDIGGGTTDIEIFKEGKVVYSASLPVGGVNITADIAAGLHLSSIEQAEKVKQNLEKIFNTKPEKPINFKEDKKSAKSNKATSAKTTKPADENNAENDKVDVSFLNIPDLKTVSKKYLKMIIDARIAEILELAEKGARQKGVTIKAPSGIIVTGGSAKLYGITKTIKDIVGVPARIGIPTGLTGMLDDIKGPEFATVYGLVLATRGLNPSQSTASSKKGSNLMDKIRKMIKSFTQ